MLRCAVSAVGGRRCILLFVCISCVCLAERPSSALDDSSLLQAGGSNGRVAEGLAMGRMHRVAATAAVERPKVAARISLASSAPRSASSAAGPEELITKSAPSLLDRVSGADALGGRSHDAQQQASSNSLASFTARASAAAARHLEPIAQSASSLFTRIGAQSAIQQMAAVVGWSPESAMITPSMQAFAWGSVVVALVAFVLHVHRRKHLESDSSEHESDRRGSIPASLSRTNRLSESMLGKETAQGWPRSPRGSTSER